MRRSDLEALELQRAQPGYRVCFERRGDGFLRTDYLPEQDEPAFETESVAWGMATRVADAVPNAVNIYVVRRDNHCPVEGYREKILRRYPGRGSSPEEKQNDR